MKYFLSDINLSKYIAFDLETTGLNPNDDSVIEFSAVLFEDGEVKETLSFLCEPLVDIPPEIETITGITQDMVKGKPSFEERLTEVVDFLDKIPLVGHNIGFDISFLKEYFKRNKELKKKRITNRLYDTSLLSQSFYFYLNDHKLTTVSEYCGVSSKGAHRAEVDAINTGRIFLKLIQRASLYDLETFQIINMILQNTNDPNKWLYRNLSEHLILKKTMGDSKPEIDWKAKSNIIGNCIKVDEESKQLPDITGNDIDNYFDEGGLISKKLTGFEPRPQQIEMAKTVLSCLNEGKSSMIEAGTGVGKSLAYLIPSILWLNNAEEKQHLAIASNTKNLQEQIFYKEIPFASEKLQLPFKAVLLKGRSNYLCFTKWYRYLADLPNKLNIANKSSIIPIVIWLKHTKTGDISECSGFKLSWNRYIWNEICSEPGYCTTNLCQKYHGCFLGKVRYQASSSDVIIVNHSLLLADSVSEKKVLPEYTTLVVDEAHNLEKNSYNYFASKINLPIINYLLKSIYSSTTPETGILIDVIRLSQQLKKRHEIEMYVEKIKDNIGELGITAAAFFKRIAVQKALNENEKKYGVKRRYKVFKDEFKDFDADSNAFIYELKNLRQNLSELITKIEELVVDFPEVFDELRVKLNNLFSQLESYQSILETSIKAENKELIFWYEIGPKGKETTVELSFTPLDVSKCLYDKIYKDLNSTILTSATLQIADSFDYLKSRTGMSHYGDEEVITSSVGSPFKYPEQAMFCTYHANKYKSNDFQSIASLIVRLADEVKKGMMVLFTSYSSLKQIYKITSPSFKKLGITLLSQGFGASRTNLLEQFRNEKKSVLFGTNSFWEGIDIIGDSLEILVIHKLPFPVPSDPIIEANVEKVQNEGKNSFFDYYVPESVLKFRQGFGRLIRSTTDTGVVINLDDRLDKKRYGEVFKKSLPLEVLSIVGKDKLIELVRKYFK